MILHEEDLVFASLFYDDRVGLLLSTRLVCWSGSSLSWRGRPLWRPSTQARVRSSRIEAAQVVEDPCPPSHSHCGALVSLTQHFWPATMKSYDGKCYKMVLFQKGHGLSSFM